MTVQPDSVIIQALISAAWVDLSDDWIRPRSTKAKWGINGNRAIDLVASSGFFNFVLDNSADNYMPGLTTSLAGWDKNTRVRIKVTYNGVAYIRFRGYVDDLSSKDEVINDKRVNVKCVDYIKLMMRTPLTNLQIQETKRADEGINTIVNTMPIDPRATSYEEGQETFLTIYDTITPQTRIYSEATKLVQSEFGYWYKTCDKTLGETLVFEDRHKRNGLRTLSKTPNDSGDALLLETGDTLLLETGDKLLLDDSRDASYTNIANYVDQRYGKDVVNYFKTTAHPKGLSASVEVLFSLESPIALGSGQVLVFRTNYADPTGGRQITAKTDTMVTPVATTDYLMNTARDGGGSNTTGDLTVSASYGTEGVKYTLTNGNAATGYVTFLQARGKGITSYSPISVEAESTTSQSSFGLEPQSVNQQYKQSVDLGELIGPKIIAAEQNPRLDLLKVNFVANKDQTLMYAFLSIDVGSLVHIKHDEKEVDDYFYVQGVEFSVEEGDVIRFSWIVRKMNSLISGGLAPVGVEFDDGTSTGINFGYLPHVSNLEKRSFSFWVYSTKATYTDWGFLFGVWGDTGATGMRIPDNATYGDSRLHFNQKHISGNQARYVTPENSLPIDTLLHIVVTRDTSTLSNPPIIYIDGVVQTLTELEAGSNALASEDSAPTTLGSIKTASIDYGWNFDGIIYDPRIYTGILSQANVTTLYNSGVIDPTLIKNNMRFQGHTVDTKKYADMLDNAMGDDEYLIDNIFGYAGKHNAGPIIRAIIWFVP